MANAIQLAIGDAVLTFIWIFISSTLGLVTSEILKAFNLEFVTYNGNASFYAAGLGSDTLFSMAIRFPAQALGAVGGAMAIKEVMPPKYLHMIGGPVLKVDLHTGAIAEGVLTFVITFLVLSIIIKGPRSEFIKTLMMSISTVAVIIAGTAYTGPSMNPILAYGWAYLDNWHHTWDQFYVYWICPFIGAILAAWLFRVVFPPPQKVVKHKKA
ncbi:unnamed protein product [Vicia faba]|uniref:Uncharacterized protein n=1 Tax=Vicia faba TaxID=3906 RepID=A0AAV0ZFW2_VICFA|nr:unnamed protein product [Vicia faba]